MSFHDRHHDNTKTVSLKNRVNTQEFEQPKKKKFSHSKFSYFIFQKKYWRSKTISFIKIHPRRPKISWIERRKTCEIIRNSNCFIYLFFLHHFQLISHVFCYSIEDIFSSSGWISPQNFANIIAKFGSKFEICWKS